MKRIGRSKSPTLAQLELMAEQLSKKLKTSCDVSLECWFHDSGNKSTEFKISLVPGFNEECTQFRFSSWNSAIDQYYFLMNSKNLEVCDDASD